MQDSLEPIEDYVPAASRLSFAPEPREEPDDGPSTSEQPGSPTGTGESEPAWSPDEPAQSAAPSNGADDDAAGANDDDTAGANDNNAVGGSDDDAAGAQQSGRPADDPDYAPAPELELDEPDIVPAPPEPEEPEEPEVVPTPPEPDEPEVVPTSPEPEEPEPAPAPPEPEEPEPSTGYGDRDYGYDRDGDSSYDRGGDDSYDGYGR